MARTIYCSDDRIKENEMFDWVWLYTITMNVTDTCLDESLSQVIWINLNHILKFIPFELQLTRIFEFDSIVELLEFKSICVVFFLDKGRHRIV